MNHHPAHPGTEPASDPKRDLPDFWRSRYSVGLVVIGAAALYFLLTEHREHFFSALPLLILLACPLMHLFMHGGHKGHGGHANQGGNEGHGCCAPSQDKLTKSRAAQQGEMP